MDREDWNERYRAKDLVWGFEPNRFVFDAFNKRAAAGRAIDLACGEGRNAIWLAKRGWRVTAIDLSDVAIERARELASTEGVDVEWICADLTQIDLEPESFDVGLVSYLQVPREERRTVLRKVAAALVPGGELFMIGHALRNLADGHGGPRDPMVLWDPKDLVADVNDASLHVERCEEVLRPIEGDEPTPPAIDVLVEAVKR